MKKEKTQIPFKNSLPAPGSMVIKFNVFRLSFETVMWKCLYLGEQKKRKKAAKTLQNRKSYICGNKSRVQLFFQKRWKSIIYCKG